MTNAKYAVQLGPNLLSDGIGDEAAWATDSVHEAEEAARDSAAARRAKRAVDSELVYRVIRIEPTEPYTKTVVEAAS